MHDGQTDQIFKFQFRDGFILTEYVGFNLTFVMLMKK